jgi:hypothetical protein
MNLQPPIDQNSIFIYSGNAQIIKARLEQFLNARPMLRKWTLPNYGRLSGFPEYEAQMKLIFHDAQIYDVVMGRALRTVPNPAEPVPVTNCRRIYDEANFQAYSLIVRTFTTANSGFVDASGSIENNGQLLWTKLVRFNYGTSDDGLPYLKAAFYDRLRFSQKEDVSLDHWAAEVRQASSILSSSGHLISEADKSHAFRHGLNRPDLQTALILPARSETFEDLVITARAFILAADDKASRLPASGRVSAVIAASDQHGGVKLDTVNTSKRRPGDDAYDVECFRCHRRGHYADVCPTPRSHRVRSHKRLRSHSKRHSSMPTK